MKKEKPEGFSYFLSKKVGKAIMDYKMLEDGDKILVAVSGGKDSMTLLKILEQRRAFTPIKYELVVTHVDMGYKCIHPKILEKYLKDNGYSYHFKKVDILKNTSRDKINCFWCSWNRRKALFETAAKLGCRKIALGHHKDDIVQTFLLNLIFQGEISAMSPRQELFKGKIVLIRPLAYLEEKECQRFAKENNFPIVHCQCPNAGKTQRNQTAKLIKQFEKMSPQFKTNIFRSLQRIKREYLL
ncbi:MAG: ATP-binding protein [Candidatus Omnitrophica bacterium]|nr:ATP-binding protein [Candidatus Omnitrophota bacterium]MDD5352895.1 ATP-binding protein [Candidatus Omnitrophota bacterium]MDD5550494.1 ATP-binding protein [Candidatus Omnitrophota bacterium]